MPKIMLVEDDNNLREIYEARLLAEGYEIISASDGEEALAMAVKEKPDLIISDVMMPKISGFDMLDILRSTPETKETKVIMMTALSQAEDKTRADNLGADRYLVKSQVTLEDVAKVAREVLEGKEAPSTSAPAEPAPETTPAATPAPTPVATPPAPEPPVAPVVTPVAPAPEPPAAVEPPAPAPTPAPADEAPAADTASAPASLPPFDDTPPAPPDPTASGSGPDPAVTPGAAINLPEPATTPAVDSKLSQSTSDEEATVHQQIQDFIATSAPTAAPAPVSTPTTAPTPIPIAQEPTPVATPPAPEPANITPQVDPSAPALSEPSPNAAAAVSHKKVIQPLDDVLAPKRSLNDLLADEEKKIAVQPLAVDSVVAPPKPADGVDPNSIAL
jgi:CheY-like chemotaxis protein